MFHGFHCLANSPIANLCNDLNWQAQSQFVTLREMTTSKAAQKMKIFALSQRQRPRPSRVKSRILRATTPGERLQLAMELSDFCLNLREAMRRRKK
jgi:hypothetical protein